MKTVINEKYDAWTLNTSHVYHGLLGCMGQLGLIIDLSGTIISSSEYKFHTPAKSMVHYM